MRLFQRDPGMFVLAFAAWAALNGISLVLPGDVFAKDPVYAEVARLAVADTWWGLGMLADALLLALTVGSGNVTVRAFAAIFSAPPWFSFGVLMVGGAAGAGFLSAAGCFDMLASFGLAVAGTQWAYTLAPAPAASSMENEPWI
jgi:hypothetical protein